MVESGASVVDVISVMWTVLLICKRFILKVVVALSFSFVLG